MQQGAPLTVGFALFSAPYVPTEENAVQTLYKPRTRSRQAAERDWRVARGLFIYAIVAACGAATPTDTEPPATPQSPQTAAGTLQWPVDRVLHDGVYVMNFVDHGGGGAARDFACGTRTYAGHKGTDIALVDFTEMDRGHAVYAARAGTVLVATDDEFDRNMEPPYVGTLNDVNMVQIRHDDGTSAWYAHLRQNSVAVQAGERVEQGAFLGMIGSSGWSPVPHLHFELWQGSTFGSRAADPWAGDCAPGTVQWSEPPVYSGQDRVNIYDADITLDLLLQGSFGNQVGLVSLKERLDRPAVVGTNEARLGVWIFHQSPTGGTIDVSLRLPDGSVFASRQVGVAGGGPFRWDVITFDFAAKPAMPGEWTLQVVAGTRRLERRFEMGDSTVMPPRFYPLRGRSLHVGTEQTLRDRLRLRTEDPSLTLLLKGAPSGVRIEGQEVVLQQLTLEHRNARFQVIATDRAGHADTMWYHVVDRTRPASPRRW